MANGRVIIAGLAAALLLAGGPAAAQDGGGDGGGDGGKDTPAVKKDDRPVSSDEAAKQAIDRFERDFKTKDLGRRMNAIHSLSMTKNDLVVKKLAALLGNGDPEIRMAAAMSLDSQYQNPGLCGEILRKTLDSGKEDDEDVLITICLTLGRIDYRASIPEMGELAKEHGNIFVKMEALKSFEKMKDVRALLPILDLWLVNPQGYSWDGGEVKVDTGASGDTDQKAAEAEYKRKYGNQRRRGAPPTMLKSYIQAICEAVAAITGEKISTCTELMQWMVEHEKELPYKLPGKVRKTLDEYESRAAKKAKEKEKEKGR